MLSGSRKKTVDYYKGLHVTIPSRTFAYPLIRELYIMLWRLCTLDIRPY